MLLDGSDLSHQAASCFATMRSCLCSSSLAPAALSLSCAKETAGHHTTGPNPCIASEATNLVAHKIQCRWTVTLLGVLAQANWTRSARWAAHAHCPCQVLSLRQGADFAELQFHPPQTGALVKGVFSPHIPCLCKRTYENGDVLGSKRLGEGKWGCWMPKPF